MQSMRYLSLRNAIFIKDVMFTSMRNSLIIDILIRISRSVAKNIHTHITHTHIHTIHAGCFIWIEHAIFLLLVRIQKSVSEKNYLARNIYIYLFCSVYSNLHTNSNIYITIKKINVQSINNNFYLFYVQWAIWKQPVQQLRVTYYFYPPTRQCFTIKIFTVVNRRWRKKTLCQERYVKKIIKS